MDDTASKILIVDDNSFYLSLLNTILKDVDAQVYMAGSGSEAMELIQKNDFALAVLDIQMPEMDGFELAGHIRNLQNRDLIPIIFLTAYFSDELQMFRGYDSGAIDYLTKPVNKTIFLSKVRVVLELDKQKKKLIESEELYHSLLRTSPDGIIITNLQGKITEVSDIAIELLGCKNRTEIEGSHFMDFIPQSSRRTLVKLFRTTQKEGLVQNLEIKLKRSDETEFSGELSSSLIKDNKGDLKAFMAVIRDISERKLFEKQLRHSERMAGIGELATGMAHEINQPLNTISLAMDNIIFALDNHSLTETYLKAKTNKVFDNITRIKKIIEHVRIFSRDQEDFVQSTFEINKSIQNSISMISEQMAHRDISLNFSPGSDLPTLIGNTYRFEQVILNLLINAKDAIEEKKKKTCKNYKKKIDVSTKLVGNQIFVEIKDNGIGIKSEDIDKVLLPFFTTKAPGQGTGLGLSISYGIIKELDGEIDIQSKPQVGTTIVMKIPAPKKGAKNKS
jgi:PAS domain S-box-containing protein